MSSECIIKNPTCAGRVHRVTCWPSEDILQYWWQPLRALTICKINFHSLQLSSCSSCMWSTDAGEILLTQSEWLDISDTPCPTSSLSSSFSRHATNRAVVHNCVKADNRYIRKILSFPDDDTVWPSVKEVPPGSRKNLLSIICIMSSV